MKPPSPTPPRVSCSRALSHTGSVLCRVLCSVLYLEGKHALKGRSLENAPPFGSTKVELRPGFTAVLLQFLRKTVGKFSMRLVSKRSRTLQLGGKVSQSGLLREARRLFLARLDSKSPLVKSGGLKLAPLVFLLFFFCLYTQKKTFEAFSMLLQVFGGVGGAVVPAGVGSACKAPAISVPFMVLFNRVHLCSHCELL